MKKLISIVTVCNDGQGASNFSQTKIELEGDETRCLSEQIHAMNFRLRTSPPNYDSSFHVAGDPTLLIILNGQLQITLPDGQSKQFCAGEFFIAEDYLAKGVDFEQGIHGHSAQVLGDQDLQALHLKLSKRS